jgi:hypothetical protein
MPQSPSATYNIQNQKLKPAVTPDSFPAIELPVNLAPSSNFARGTILGRITSSANEVQTLDVTATVSGGTFILTGVNPLTGLTFSTPALAHNVSNANLQAALEVGYGVGNVLITNGPMPSDTTITFQGALAGMPIPTLVIASSVTGGGTVVVVKTTTGRTADTYRAYANGNSDGSQDGHCILPFACSTDASGLISLTPTGGNGAYHQEKFGNSIGCYFTGVFRTADLVGYDSESNLGNTKWALIKPGMVRLI